MNQANNQPNQIIQDQGKITQIQNKIDDIQSIYNQLRSSGNTILKESSLENTDLNLKSFQNFLPKDSLIFTKRLDQLFALTRNLRKTLEKDIINENSINSILSKNNINFQKLEKDVNELQSSIQTKYELPTAQMGQRENEKFFHGDHFELSLEQKRNCINANVSTSDVGGILSYVENTRKYVRFICDNNPTNPTNMKTQLDIKPTIIQFKQGSDLELFDCYFNIMKSYFRFRIRKNTGGVDINNTIIDEMRTTLNQLSASLTSGRKMVMDLLFHQISALSSSSKAEPTSISLTSASQIYYEKVFTEEKINRNNSYSTNVEKNIMDYACSVLYTKFPNGANSERKDELLRWCVIFYYIRSGMTDKCSQYINSLNTFDPSLTLFSSLLSQNIISTEDYGKAVSEILPSDKFANPFKHACFVLITKKNQAINEDICEDSNDYIWFHLALINVERSKYARIQPPITGLALEELQQFIIAQKNEMLESTGGSFEYVKMLTSILLYNDALEYMQTASFGADLLNYYFILKQVGLCENITKNERIEFDETQFSQFDTIPQKYIGDRLYQSIFYIRYSDGNYVESIAHIIEQTNTFECLLDNGSVSVLNEDDILVKDIFTEEDVKEILTAIVAIITKANKEYNSSFDVLLNLLKQNKLIDELITLLSFGINRILQQKVPNKIYNDKIHQIYCQRNGGTRLITNTYRPMLNEINSVNLTKEQFYNFKFIRQLETFEEVYDLIWENKEEFAINIFMRVALIEEENIDGFINTVYSSFNDYLKEMYGDVLYTYFYLVKTKLEGERDGSDSAKILRGYLKIIGNIAEKMKILKTNTQYKDKFEEIENLVNAYTATS